MKKIEPFALPILLALGLISSAAAALPDPPQNPAPAWIYAWPHFARVTWDPVPGADSYNLYRYDETAQTWQPVAPGVTNPMAFDPTAGSAGRSYRVTALNAEGESSPSAVVTTQDSDYFPYFSFTPPGTYPGTLSPTSATIQWVVSLTTGADGMLEIGLSLTNLTVVAFQPEYAFGHSVQLTNLTPATTYFYRVASVGPNRVGSTAMQMFTTPDYNHPPAATDITLPPIVDPWTVTLTLTGSDPDGIWSPLGFAVVTPPTNGTLSEIYYDDYWGPRYVDYTPSPGARGGDSFQYVVNDGELNSNPATVSIPSLWLNRTPQPVSFSTNALEDTPLSLTLQATDEDGDALTFSFGGCLHGTVSGEPPNLVYTPEPEFSGTDLVLFTVNDGYLGGLAQGTIHIEVQAVNDPPLAIGQTLATSEDTALSISLAATDPDSAVLTMAVLDPPLHGTLSGTPPNLIYTPAANYAGPDRFRFQATDGVSSGPMAEVALTILPVNDSPVVVLQNYVLAEDTVLSFTVAAADADGDNLAFQVSTLPSHGSLTGVGPNYVYTPAANFSGLDRIDVVVSDGQGGLDSTTIEFAVQSVADAPRADAQAVAVPYNTAVAVTLTGSDVDGDVLSYVVVSSPAGGVLTGTGPNLTFTPTVGWTGVTTFAFKVNDGGLDSGVATVTLTVNPPSGVPTPPNGLAATVVSRTQINLGWNDNSSNEDGFKIERSTNGSSWTQIATVGRNVRNYSSTGLSANKTYYYRVRAFNIRGNSTYSNVVTAKTLR